MSSGCDKCLSGWIVEPDGGNGLAQRCECRLRLTGAALDERLRSIGMDLGDVESGDLATHPWNKAENNFFPARVDEWLAAHLAGERVPPVVLLYGPPGRGKSKLAAHLIRRLVSARPSAKALWVYWARGVRALLSERDLHPSETLETRMEGADFLVLDDVTKRLDQFGLEVLEREVDARINNYRPTVCTCNLELGHELDAVFGATLASRLSGGLAVPMFGSRDMRPGSKGPR